MWPSIEICLVLILAPISKALDWKVNVTRTINASWGRNVTIYCTFICPDSCHTQNPKLYWKLPYLSKIKTDDKDRRAFAYHNNTAFVVDKYKGKTRLIGDSKDQNCSLQILNVQENESQLYLRIVAAKDNYSFINDFVTISVSGSDVPAVTVVPSPVLTIVPTGEGGPPDEDLPVSMKILYIAIFVPIAALLVIIGAIACVCHRSRSLTREGSGYYANFSRSNSAKRNQDQDEDLPDLVIDEPVYVNLEQPAAQMDQPSAHTENIYGNVDYFK